MRPGNRMRVGLLAAGEAGDDHVAILEAHRQGTAVGAPGRGRHGRQAAGEWERAARSPGPRECCEYPRSCRRSRPS